MAVIPQKTRGKIERVLKAAGEVAPVLAMAGFRSKWMAGLAVAIKAVEVIHNIASELQVGEANPWDYFAVHGEKTNREWLFVNSVFQSIFKGRIFNSHIVARTRDDGMQCAWEGDFDGCRVGWIAMPADTKGSSNPQLFFVWHEHEKKMMDLLHKVIWENCDSMHMSVSASEGLVEDEFKPIDTLRMTNLIKDLEERVSAFLEDGDVRSYLVVGKPGTGKTTSIQHVTRSLGLKSLRVPLAELCGDNLGNKPSSQGEPSESLPLIPLLKIAQPDVVILDDIDHAPKRVQLELMDFMELARQHVKVLLSSANHLKPIIPALKRVERFDDHIEVPELGRDTVEEILGVHKEFADQMAAWPIAYIFDFLKRVRVLGIDQARKELPKLEKRIEEDAMEPSVAPAIAAMGY